MKCFLFNLIFVLLFLKEPRLNISCSYSNGILNKQSIHLKSSCKSGEIDRMVLLNNFCFIDIHCQFPLKFNHNEKPNQCECNGQFQFEIEHCCRLMEQVDNKEK
jgi:hypothetical protein